MLQPEPVSPPNSLYLDFRINQVEFYRHPRLEGDSIGRRALDTFDIVKKTVRTEIVLIPCDGTCYLNVSKAIGVLLEDFGFCLCTRESILGLFDEFWTVNHIGCRDHDERGVALGMDIDLPMRQRSKGFELISVPVARSDLERILERSNNGCAICLQEFTDEEPFPELQCLHLFHRECIDDWLRKNNTCPLCRLRLECDDVCKLRCHWWHTSTAETTTNSSFLPTAVAAKQSLFPLYGTRYAFLLWTKMYQFFLHLYK